MPWYRCTLEDEGRSLTMTLDVLANREGIVDKTILFFGYYRDNKVTDNSPLALSYDGKIDWGSLSTWVSTLDIRGRRLSTGAIFSYAVYKTTAALDRGETYWTADLTLRSYRNLDD